jgi:hypothetical protein
MLTASGSLQPISEGLVPWKAGVYGPVDETPFGEVPFGALAPVTYRLFAAAAPAGSLDDYASWETFIYVICPSPYSSPS